jgi:hypothetical protein
MTDFRDPDPRMRDVDPRLDPRMRDYDDRYASDSRPPWGWIAGAIFVFLVLAVIFSYGGSGERSAGTDIAPPASTTGMAPPANPRPAAPAPLTPPAPPTRPGMAQ